MMRVRRPPTDGPFLSTRADQLEIRRDRCGFSPAWLALSALGTASDGLHLFGLSVHTVRSLSELAPLLRKGFELASRRIVVGSLRVLSALGLVRSVLIGFGHAPPAMCQARPAARAMIKFHGPD